ncbi:hypothetical protein BD626DRAFT_537124 [Schizophyllum amplum]|uniref:Uncharacterized protein n=1 Tax=Schizophyllum amplum TaxID=97359 RepID=A0A550CEJ0_9AGAR|nr:hypothetical protein BD626DRAFT_537124 [Auriculariopsis ampla]
MYMPTHLSYCGLPTTTTSIVCSLITSLGLFTLHINFANTQLASPVTSTRRRRTSPSDYDLDNSGLLEGQPRFPLTTGPTPLQSRDYDLDNSLPSPVTPNTQFVNISLSRRFSTAYGTLLGSDCHNDMRLPGSASDDTAAAAAWDDVGHDVRLSPRATIIYSVPDAAAEFAAASRLRWAARDISDSV